MDRKELIEALESFSDETDIRVCQMNGTGLSDIVRVTYVPMTKERPAYLCLCIPTIRD